MSFRIKSSVRDHSLAFRKPKIFEKEVFFPLNGDQERICGVQCSSQMPGTRSCGDGDDEDAIARARGVA